MKYRFYLFTLLVYFLDHLTKWVVRSRMNLHDSIEVIRDYLNITYVQNSGVAFGWFADIQSGWKPYILSSMAVVAIVVILMYSLRIPLERTLLHLALAVTLGGILGNFTDRIVDGFVVDFIEVHIQEFFRWPTFNIADSAITIGIAMLLVDSVKNPETGEKETT